MVKRGIYKVVMMAALVSAVGIASAQRGGGGFGGGRRGGRGGGAGFGGGGGGGRGMNTPDIPELPRDRAGSPTWPIDPGFKSDVFTFVRLRYPSVGRGASFPDGEPKTGGNWLTDFPGSDMHFSFRLHQTTSLIVDPDPKRIDITDDALFDYPMVYILEVGRLEFTEEQVKILRRYLLNGGFLMVDDHWGLGEQRNWREQLHRIFPEPERQPQELDITHPIFHCVFNLKALPQVPGVQAWFRFQSSGQLNRTWEQTDDTKPHYRATFDGKGRIMVLECANTDLGDGWEEEGTNEEYFHKFSATQAYPMGVNIIFWAMTH